MQLNNWRTVAVALALVALTTGSSFAFAAFRSFPSALSGFPFSDISQMVHLGADVPLRVTRPNASQWRVLLERWLEVKAEVLAGKPPSTALDQLAAPEQLDRLTSARNADQRAGHHMSIEASISDLRVRELDPETIELLAGIRYSDKLLDQNGRVLRSDPPKTLRNTYVFGRQADGLWRLTDFRPGS